jgi:hypothetical protein
LVALRQEYTKLTREIQLYSKEQRESAEGLSKIKLAGNLKKEILSIDQSIGDFRSNIGNYKSALLDVGDIVTGGLLTGWCYCCHWCISFICEWCNGSISRI